jgi:hypothetical protein
MAEEELELWGFHSDDVESVRELLEGALEVRFAMHESDTIGPYYFSLYCEPHADLTLRPNVDAAYDEDTDDPDSAYAEPDFPEYGVLLYVDWRTRAHACREKLKKLGPEAQLLLVE